MPTPYYLMRARDPDCGPQPSYVEWVVDGVPDGTGVRYTGARCGVSPLEDISYTLVGEVDTPIDLGSGLLHFVEASLITETLGRVSAITDQGTAGRNYTQGTAARRPLPLPTGGPTATPAIDFTGANQEWLSASMSGLSIVEGEMYVVCRMKEDPSTAPTGSGGAWQYGFGNTFHPDTAGVTFESGLSDRSHNCGDLAFDLTGWHLWNVRSASGAWRAALNGTVVAGPNGNFPTLTNPQYLGTLSAGATSANMIWCCQFIVNRILTEPERRQYIYDWAQIRYGLSIP